MWPDVVEMRNFYKTSLAQVVRRVVLQKIRELIPNVKHCNMLALGYPTPFLHAYRNEAQRIVAVMPAEQGALSWSGKQPNIVILSDEEKLPIADKSVDIVLLSHALEFTSSPKEMLREVWRVLADGGQLIVIVPNRASIWSRIESTPFGQGHPFSLFQLTKLLRENMFNPFEKKRALYLPPTKSRLLLKAAFVWEKIGSKWFKKMSGLLIVSASKEVYAIAPFAKKKILHPSYGRKLFVNTK